MRRMSVENLGETLAGGCESRIHLCGRFTVRLNGKRVEGDLPGRQGRMLFAYLAAHRMRPATRGELLEVLWPRAAPAAAESALAALLAKLRRALGAATLAGKQDLQLVLPGDAWIDLEAAAESLHGAESAAAAHDWARAWGPARVAMHIAARGFMPGYDMPWTGTVRQRLDDLLVRAHECVATSALAIGGAEIATAQRAARRLTELAPYRESGYRLLMQTLAASDNVGEALLVYERLRCVMRDELGASPGTAIQALHRQLLQGHPVAPPG